MNFGVDLGPQARSISSSTSMAYSIGVHLDLLDLA